MTLRKRDWLVFLYCLLAAAVCLAICSKSSFLYPINDWTDANAYFSCGKGMLGGRVMYRDLYEHKGPLLYALHVLCAWVEYSSFLGVFFLEILAVGLFLLAAYKTLQLYGAERTSLFWLTLVLALVLSSTSFQQGDSAEELCLPLLAWSLYGLLQWLRQSAPNRMPAGKLLLHGFLCGCVLWIKFTMLGFYVAWILGIMIYHLRRRDGMVAFSSLLWFALGVVLATIPWVIYFGVNNAILDWLKTYLYDNIFLYQDEETLSLAARGKAVLAAGINWVTLNWAYVAPMLLGVLYFTFGKKPAAKAQSGENNGAVMEGEKQRGFWPKVSCAEKVFLWALIGFLALGVFIGGKTYLYYGLILSAFAPLAALPFARWTDRLLADWQGRAVALTVIGITCAGMFCLAASPNTPDLLKPREDTMQYRFAAIVDQTPDATLLNYGFMDAGFYTACNIAPTVKYFHQTNVHLQEMLDEQIRYIEEGVTDYVVTRGRQPDSIANHYDLVATEESPDGFWYDHVYLYRRKDIAAS